MATELIPVDLLYVSSKFFFLKIKCRRQDSIVIECCILQIVLAQSVYIEFDQ